jgi:nucleoside-diphosphate-sugar epimerase
MRVLVRGSQGYIGSIPAPTLIDAGHEVVGLDSDLYRECTYGEAMPEVRLIRKDIRDVETSDLDGFDAVIHLLMIRQVQKGDTSRW